MFEAIPSINNAKENPDQEPLVPAVELNEAELNEFRKDIAETYRVPYDGSYFKKLKRVIGAFVLAGMAVMASPQEGTAPVLSEERLAIQEYDWHKAREAAIFRMIASSLKDEGDVSKPILLPGESSELEISDAFGGYGFSEEDNMVSEWDQRKKKEREIFERIESSLKEKGGITESPQLPDRIYKPIRLANAAQTQAFKAEGPYFLKPEIVLGQDFVRKNPEKAGEYMKKIEKVIEATTMIKTQSGTGSGVIVNTKAGRIILTNEHVVGDDNQVKIKYSNNETALAEVVARDQKKDLAIVRIIEWDENGEYADLGATTKALDIEADNFSRAMKPGEKMALVGNPLGFPFEAAVTEFRDFDDARVHFMPIRDAEKKVRNKNNKGDSVVAEEFCDFSMLNSTPDSRFNNLALYEREGEVDDAFNRLRGGSKFGMSGGPIVSLEKDGKPKLIGLNVRLGLEEGEKTSAKIKIMGKDVYDKAEPSKNEFVSIGISAKDIREFLAQNGY